MAIFPVIIIYIVSIYHVSKGMEKTYKFNSHTKLWSLFIAFIQGRSLVPCTCSYIRNTHIVTMKLILNALFTRFQELDIHLAYAKILNSQECWTRDGFKTIAITVRGSK
jgi:hypothetical protein